LMFVEPTLKQLLPVIKGVGSGLTVTDIELLLEHEFASVTVTE